MIENNLHYLPTSHYTKQRPPLHFPYKDDYLLGKEGPERAGHIWLLAADGRVKELAEESVLIGALRNRTTKRMRGYLHRDYLSLLEGGSA